MKMTSTDLCANMKPGFQGNDLIPELIVYTLYSYWRVSTSSWLNQDILSCLQ